MRTCLTVAVLTVGFLLAYAYVYRSENGKPEERSFTMAGRTKVVCGWLTVPYDTHSDRIFARGTEHDCGFTLGPPKTGRPVPIEQ